jgi:hypothetical protein
LTYGIDAGYSITPDFTASVGYYYQDGDGSSADSSGVLGRLGYEITNGLIVGVNISYDEVFETRVSADIEYRFGGPTTTIAKKRIAELPIIKSLSSSPSKRDVRVHDYGGPFFEDVECIPTPKPIRTEQDYLDLRESARKAGYVALTMNCKNGFYQRVSNAEFGDGGNAADDY